MSHPPAPLRRRLSVVFVQYDRFKYSDSLSRVIALLDRLKGAESTVVVVDNREPGEWVHEVSSRLIHIGGDNSAWEFSAFDRGIRFLQERKTAGEIFAFVTDALLAYGDEFLKLIDDHALDVCAKAQACVGWVDSLPQAYEIGRDSRRSHLRTSFLLMPAAVVAHIAPLTTPLDPAALFGSSAAQPFRGDAPLSDSVKGFLLAWLTTGPAVPATGERWHSAFELNADTLAFFQAKALAILRELSLSARLAAAKVPLFDLRLIRFFAETALPPTEQLATALPEGQWRDWYARKVVPLFHNIDVCDVPASLAHGQAANVVVEGWVATDPQVREVEVAVGEATFRARCDRRRSDVLAAHAEVRDEFTGFRLLFPLPPLRPGVHEAVWRVPGTSLEQTLGRLVVSPAIGFEVAREWIPDTPGPDGDLPFSIDGRVVSSSPLKSVRVRWDGLEISPFHVLGEERVDASGLRTRDLAVRGTLSARGEPRQHTLELWLEGETGETTVWCRFVMVQPAKPAGPYCLSVREVGPFDPATGETRVRLRGVVNARPGDVLALLSDGQGILELPLVRRATMEVPSPTWFDFEREVTALPPGERPLALVLRRPGAEDREVVSWVERVQLLRHILHLDQVEAQPGPGGPGQYLLRLDGWVENDFIVSFVNAAVDGVPVGRFDLDVPRPDVAAATGNGLISRQGFHYEMPVRAEPGDHELVLTAIQAGGEPVVWRHELHLEPHPVQRFGLDSEDLEALRRPGPKTFWSSFVARGYMRSSLQEVCASLSVDGTTVNEQDLSGDQHFSLRYTPRHSGSHTVRVRFEAAGQSLFDSGSAKVAIRALAVPEWTGEALGLLLGELVPGRSLGHGLTPHDVVRRLMEARPEGVSQLLSLLARVGDRRRVTRRSALLPRDLPWLDGPRLSVLIGSWQVPSSRHGGGVYLHNLLKELGRRHRITVVHAFNPDETGWEAEIRPFVSEVISVPRGHTRFLHRRDPWVPIRYEECYTPALRRAIECEIATGSYDLVDYEYTAMVPHYERADIPRVQTILELSHLAVAATCLMEPSSPHEAVDQVALLLEAYNWDTMVLPGAARHLVTVSPEDGAALARGQDEADVYVNPIPVDAERLAPPLGNERTGNTVVFLGNFLHLPNVEAAKFLVTEVMPRIRMRNPDAHLLIIGPYVPAELEHLAGDRGDIEFTGFLEDFRPPLWRAAAFLAPIFSGAGMRVKIAEAMACGCPVISSRLGVNGLEAEDGMHYLNAEDADGFAEAAFRVLSDRRFAESLGSAARRLVLDIHGCEGRAAEREAIWQRAVSLHALHAVPSLRDPATHT